jgi:hypothetical protein
MIVVGSVPVGDRSADHATSVVRSEPGNIDRWDEIGRPDGNDATGRRD